MPLSPKKETRVYARVPPQQKAKLQKQATLYHTSVSDVIRNAIDHYLNYLEGQDSPF